MNTTEILNGLRAENKRDFPVEIFEQDRVEYPAHMRKLMDDKGVSIADLVKSMGYERSYVYHMLDGSRTPSRYFLLRFAIVCGLDFEETQRILFITGNGLLYAKVEYDAAIIYSLERHYDFSQVNDLLESVGMKHLFSDPS
ncbi:MAG: helix-turn-helix transcriptional regulator [Eubacterium sp.]|nr:helix-turn-helix transcriptional regulator [Eubacterium sp.]